MVAIEHRQKPTVSSTTSAATPSSSSSASTHEQQQQQQEQDEQQDEQQHADVIIGMTQEQSEQQPLTTASEVRICHSRKMSKNEVESAGLAKRHEEAAAAAISKSAVSQRNVDINLASSKSSGEGASAELSKKVLTLDLTGKDTDDFSLKSPKSPISARLSHQTSLTSSVDVEDRKTLREALYQGIFHRHRRTIFAVGSFLRMLRSRNSQYNTIRSSSEGEDMEEVR